MNLLPPKDPPPPLVECKQTKKKEDAVLPYTACVVNQKKNIAFDHFNPPLCLILRAGVNQPQQVQLKGTITDTKRGSEYWDISWRWKLY